MIFYTSDLHIGHTNALIFDNRLFLNIDEMAEAIIDKWNNKVTDNDTVYILGDVFYRYKEAPQIFLGKLKGHKNLIVGNHDFKIILKNNAALKCFESVDNLKRIEDNGRIVILCHYPIIDWDQKHRGAYHIYGHVHNHLTQDTHYMMKQENAYNAGCMINNYEPCTLEELIDNNKIFKEKYFN